jgi:outer membrane receptor protein involved in Fe transport
MRTRFKGTLTPVSFAIALAVLSQTTLAQPNTLESIVITADRQQDMLRDVPASIFTLDNSALETVRHVHINESAVRIPGVWISRNNGQESLTAIRSPVLSGAGSCGAFQMSLDGIPLRAAGFCNVNQIFEANTEQAGSIEVIRGPGSILYGANAMHGAINIISGSITDEFSGDVGLDVGPHDYGRFQGTLSNTFGNNGYRISFNGASDGGYKDDSGYGQQKLTMQHRYSGENVTITNSFHATNLNQETAGYIEGHEAYKDDDQKRINPDPAAYRDTESYRLSSQIVFDALGGTWQFTPYYRHVDMDFLQHFLPGLPLEENGQQSFGLQSMFSSTFGERVTWQAGLDTETTEGFLKETQSMPATGSPTLVETIPVGKHYDYEVDAVLVSPFVQTRFQVNPQHQLSLGVRYESLEYDYDNRMIDGRVKEDGTPCGLGGCRFNRPADRSDDYENASMQLGWIYDFADNQQVYVNYAQAFRAPDTAEVYRLQGAQNVADLKSEEMDNIEVGYRADLDRISYTVAAYYMDKENVIFQNSNRINISGAQTKHRGVEFNGVMPFADAWTLSVAASYARHTYEGNVNPGAVQLAGLDMDTAPRFTGSSQLNWQISEDRSLELELVHIGSYFTDEANTAKYDGHDLVNLRYQATAGDHWYYSARITNLFNTDYAERADFAFGNDRYFVGEPISLYFTIGQKF